MDKYEVKKYQCDHCGGFARKEDLIFLSNPKEVICLGCDDEQHCHIPAWATEVLDGASY